MTKTPSMTGYTCEMKTAVSLPDEVFREADQLADRLGWSRSQLYTRAVREFIERQGDDPVTTALDAIVDEVNGEVGLATGRALIDAGAWEW